MLLTATWYAIAFAGGLVLFAGPFTRSFRAMPRWICVALWIAGSTSLGWSSLGFTLVVGSGSLSKGTYDSLVQLKTTFLGMAIAMLILLFASGEFAKYFGRSATKGQ